MKKIILAALVVFNSLNASEKNSQDFLRYEYIKKMPTQAEIRAQKVYGAVTLLIPIASFVLPNIIVNPDVFFEDFYSHFYPRKSIEFNPEQKLFWTSLSIVTAILTALIPFHFFNKASQYQEKQKRFTEDLSLSGQVKNLIKKHLPV